MRIARAPLRITLGGGGTDLPGYYEKYGGFLIAATINKFIYMTCSRRPFDKNFWLSYANLEVTDSIEKIRHELLRQGLAQYSFKTGVEIHSISEVSGNTGLGSSGAFLVCLLTLLNSLEKREMTRQDVAELASRIEMVDLAHSCGKQDSYASAFGGISTLEIDRSGKVTVSDLSLDRGVLQQLQNSLLIYYTGQTRQAQSILGPQVASLKGNVPQVVSGFQRIKEIGLASKECLLKGQLDDFGRLLHEHWELKKSFQTEMSNTAIDATYKAALQAGALGGKVMGAGGGGFFLFYVPLDKQISFRKRMAEASLQELDWRFNMSGCEIIFAN